MVSESATKYPILSAPRTHSSSDRVTFPLLSTSTSTFIPSMLPIISLSLMCGVRISGGMSGSSTCPALGSAGIDFGLLFSTYIFDIALETANNPRYSVSDIVFIKFPRPKPNFGLIMMVESIVIIRSRIVACRVPVPDIRRLMRPPTGTSKDMLVHPGNPFWGI